MRRFWGLIAVAAIATIGITWAVLEYTAGPLPQAASPKAATAPLVPVPMPVSMPEPPPEPKPVGRTLLDLHILIRLKPVAEPVPVTPKPISPLLRKDPKITTEAVAP